MDPSPRTQVAAFGRQTVTEKVWIVHEWYSKWTEVNVEGFGNPRSLFAGSAWCELWLNYFAGSIIITWTWMTSLLGRAFRVMKKQWKSRWFGGFKQNRNVCPCILRMHLMSEPGTHCVTLWTSTLLQLPPALTYAHANLSTKKLPHSKSFWYSLLRFDTCWPDIAILADLCIVWILERCSLARPCCKESNHFH